MNFKIVQPQLNDTELIALMAAQFPSIKDELYDEDDRGLLYMQIATLTRYANECIDKARFGELQRIFDFMNKVISKVSSKAENAFYVSFLEHLEMDGDSEKQRTAIRLLPKQYLKDYRTLRNPT